MAFYFYYATLKFIVLASLAFFLIDNNNANYKIIAINTLFLAIVYFFSRKIFQKKIKIRGDNKLKIRNKLIVIRLTFFISLLCVLLAYGINGFPMLMQDVNAAKVSLSNNPILMRGLRFIVPGLIFVRMWFYHSKINAKIEHKDIYIFAFACIVTIFSGYKGYFLNYIIMPIVISHFLYSTKEVKFLKIIFSIFIIIFVVIANIMINEGEGVSGASMFLLMRATYSQVEGSVHILNNIDYYYGVSPFLENIGFLSGKFIGNGELLNFNARIFKDIQGDNPLGMQVSIPNFVELFVDGGLYLMIPGVVLESFLIILTLNLIKKSASPIVLALLYMAFFYLVDISINGAAMLKLIDYVISSIFFLIVYFFSKTILSIVGYISRQGNN